MELVHDLSVSSQVLASKDVMHIHISAFSEMCVTIVLYGTSY